MNNRQKLLGWLVLAAGVAATGASAAETDLERSFKSPPVAARPWVYWWWLNSNVTREGITRDLEEMHKQGIQGVMVFNAGGGDTPAGPKFLGPEWKELYKFAMSEVSRLGMEASVSLCDGWCSGGPWIPAEAANKKLTWSECQVDGPRTASLSLPLPQTFDNFYRDVAVVAVREEKTRPVRPAEIRASSGYTGPDTEYVGLTSEAADGDPNTYWTVDAAPAADKPAWIEYVYSEPLSAAAVYVVGRQDGGPDECELSVSADGKEFKSVAAWRMAKSEAKRVEFAETTANVFRLSVKSAHGPGVGVAEMWLLRKGDEPVSRPGVKWWLFKSGNRSFWHYPREGSAVIEDGYPEDGAVDCRSGETVELTSKMDKDGKLTWDVPDGRWTVLRFGYTLEGQRTRCSSTVIGYEADMLDPIGAETHFKHCAAPLIDAAGEFAGKTLKYLHVDSYETGADVGGQQPTWSAVFLEEFRKRRGYDPLPYLAAMTRRIVDNREKTERFLWDVRMTVSDLMVDRFFGRLGELAHARGVGIHCETGYGTYPHPHFDGLRAAGQCDVTMGEFWWGTDVMTLTGHFCNSIRSVASSAHVYGKRIVQAESFTSWRHFPEYPATLKPVGDLAYCDGLNRVMFHQYTHQPNEDQPGYQYFAGTHVDRHLTWWKMAPAWFAYLTRCQQILQNGRFHADACYFYGEGSAKFVPTKKYLKPELPAGYNFDCVNADVLLNRMNVKNGEWVLPDGVSYKLLVLPTQRAMTPAVLRRIRNLVAAGAIALGDKPVRTPGLSNWPECDAELKALTDEMWGPNPDAKGRRTFGNGQLVWGSTPGEVLAGHGAPPDFEVEGGNEAFEFIHRVIGDADVYFVCNQSGTSQKRACAFRIAGRQPELWNPVDGTVRPLPEFTVQRNGTTLVPMTFEPYQSFFVVFRTAVDDASAAGGGRNFATLKQVAEIAGPWTVAFDPKWGGPEKIVFDKLADWTQRPEEGIKYYSGTAVYRQTFDLADASEGGKKKCFLDLGVVDYIARVRLNGKDLGVLWTAPWRVDITGIAKEKGNELEIEVVNTWLNRMVGDARLPVEKRLCKTNATYPGDHSIMPSGLLGPVTVQVEE